ncbi:DUF3631 domain-containing protein [Streptomyces sp. NPDC054835]|uniref:DUF3631 domain-containing protein n=1 Tax=Streptomyces exfoliatus TaxID=1905 RepID=UPI000464B695|nr:DUF3631 domain-containing protein [Streptomyces exfoliatus]
MTTARSPLLRFLDILLDDGLTHVPAPAPNPHHQALLDAKTRQDDLERELLDIITGPTPDTDAAVDDEIEDIAAILKGLVAAGRDVNRLLGDHTCAGPVPMVETEPDEAALSMAPCCSHPRPLAGECIAAACLAVFSAYGSPDALASADLVDGLRTLPGTAEGRWPYEALTQARLATLLRPYEVSSRDITLPDGRRRKSYRRTALLAALCSDCSRFWQTR